MVEFNRPNRRISARTTQPPGAPRSRFSHQVAQGASPGDFDVEVFFDGDCPLCVREIDMLRRLDRRERIRFTDIAESSFDSREVGVDWNTLMARIHGRLPDGTLIEGVEVFRRLYAAAGFPRLVAATRWPGVAPLLDAAYRFFARHRLRLTGRCHDGACELQRGVTTP